MNKIKILDFMAKEAQANWKKEAAVNNPFEGLTHYKGHPILTKAENMGAYWLAPLLGRHPETGLLPSNSIFDALGNAVDINPGQHHAEYDYTPNRWSHILGEKSALPTSPPGKPPSNQSMTTLKASNYLTERR